MEGVMKKKGHRVHNWKERFFVLKECSLSYFGDSNEQKVRTIMGGNATDV